MAKKGKVAKNGNIKDLRTKQILKQYPDGIKDRKGAFWVPKDVKNELMDLARMSEKPHTL